MQLGVFWVILNVNAHGPATFVRPCFFEVKYVSSTGANCREMWATLVQRHSSCLGACPRWVVRQICGWHAVNPNISQALGKMIAANWSARGPRNVVMVLSWSSSCVCPVSCSTTKVARLPTQRPTKTRDSAQQSHHGIRTTRIQAPQRADAISMASGGGPKSPFIFAIIVEIVIRSLEPRMELMNSTWS